MARTELSRHRKRSFISLPDGWDDAWKAALAASGSAPASVAFLGDSFTMGKAATDYANSGFVGLLASQLAAKYGRYGDFWPPVMSSAFAGWNGTPPWVITATNLTWWGRPFGKAAGWNPTPGGNLAVFTSPYAHQTADVFYNDQVTGTWTVTITGANGGTAVAVQGGGGSASTSLASGTLTVTVTNSNGVFPRKLHVTGLDNSTHVFTFTTQSANNALLLQGIATYSGTTGIGVARNGISGAKLQDLVFAMGLGTLDGAVVWQGKTDSATTGLGFPTQPDLLVMAWGVNECVQGAGLDALQQGYRRVFQAARRGKRNASLLIIVHSNPAPESSDSTGLFGESQNYPLYVARLYAVASEFGAGVVNFHAKWGETSETDGLRVPGDGHPSDAGHLDMATTLASILV